MPINFEATFVQPVLAELDAGRIKNASDWARVITRYYVNTIKTGAPTGIPFTLPSPAALGAPYPIGNTFYNTIDAKSRLMENIIKAYFLTEEIKIQRSGIKGLLQTIKQLLQKGKELKRQIKSTVDQIKQVKKELQELPATLSELYASITEEIQTKIQQVTELGTSIDNFILQTNDPSLRNLFANEIYLIDTIKNFKFDFSLQTLQKITMLTTSTDTAVTQLGDRFRNEQALKAYATQTLTTIVKDLFQLVNTAVSPAQYISVYSQLASTNSRARLIYEMLKRIEFFEKKLQPKLIKLEKKLQDKKDQLEKRVNNKIEELKKDVQSRAEELAKRKGDGKDTFFKNAKKTLTDYRKKYKEEFDKKRKTIKKYTTISKLSLKIFNKSSAIILGIEAEINKIADQVDTVSDDAVDSNKQIIQEFTKEAGLEQIANLLTQLVVDNKLNAMAVKELLTTKSAVVANYYNQLKSIAEQDIPALFDEIRNTPKQERAIEQEKETSFLNVYDYYKYTVKPKIRKLDEYVKKKIEEQRKLIEEKIDASKEDLTDFGINLIPVKSDSEDIKTKKLELEEKKRLIEDKKKKLQTIKKKIACGKQLAQGSSTLIKNISQGDYSYSKNEIAINQIADGYFDYKSIGQNPNQLSVLLEKKKKFKQRMNDLSIIDGLLLGIRSLVAEIKADPQFFKNWDEKVLSEITDNRKITTFQTLGQILDGTITNPKDIIEAANKLSYSIIQDRDLVNNIASVEKRYTQKTIQLFKRIGESETPAGEYFKYYLVPELEGSKSITLFLFSQLETVKNNIESYVNKFIDDAKVEIKRYIDKRKQKIIEDNKESLDKLKEKAVNVKAGVMSLTFSLATRILWSGATWVGPTGTIFTVVSIGPFKPMKAQVAGGASALVREMARGFETQLKILTGTYSNPGAGITPIPFVGYS
jgi:uncharacterized coiled-coil DUF342 family protein